MKSLIQNVFGVICALCLSACASASSMPSDDAKVWGESMGAVKLLHARLERATDKALQIVRYNPTNCRCPPFEILLSEHWHRVDLAVSDVDNPILGELLRLTSEERAEEALQHYRLTGTFEPTLQECGRGLPMVTFRPSEFLGVDTLLPEKTEPEQPSLEQPETPVEAEQKESHWNPVVLPPCG